MPGGLKSIWALFLWSKQRYLSLTYNQKPEAKYAWLDYVCANMLTFSSWLNRVAQYTTPLQYHWTIGSQDSQTIYATLSLNGCSELEIIDTHSTKTTATLLLGNEMKLPGHVPNPYHSFFLVFFSIIRVGGWVGGGGGWKSCGWLINTNNYQKDRYKNIPCQSERISKKHEQHPKPTPR